VSVFAMIETAAALSDVDEICAVPGLAGLYVGPADLAISMGVDVTKATTDPAVREAITRIHGAASGAGLVAAIHAGNSTAGHALAQLGFQMLTLESESQALRRGAAASLREARADR
jgi:4-hydroxy-2-oxoheptanedioate aldolase